VRCGFCIIERSFPYPAGLLASLHLCVLACTYRLSILLNRASHENVPLSIMSQSPTDKHGRSTVSSPNNNNKSITLKNVLRIAPSTHGCTLRILIFIYNCTYTHTSNTYINVYVYFFVYFCLRRPIDEKVSRVNFLPICHDPRIGLSSADVLLASSNKYTHTLSLTHMHAHIHKSVKKFFFLSLRSKISLDLLVVIMLCINRSFFFYT